MQRASEGLSNRQQTAAGQYARGEHDAAVSRDRVTVDLRGIGPAVKAEADVRNLSLAAFARAAMVDALKQAIDEPKRLGATDLHHGQTVKLTLRLPVGHAGWLVEHARAAGLSYGTFLASVIEGAPCPGSLAEAVRSLTESTDQMAALSRDLNAGMRLPGAAKTEEARKYHQQVVELFDEVRQHLRLTSALAGDVRRALRFRLTDSNQS